MNKGNLAGNIPSELPEELVEILAEGSGGVRIERIVSRGHSSPPDFWYDQKTTEWVTLLKGTAVLQFENDPETVKLLSGDWIEIPAGCRHRIEETSSESDTIWLAVHWGDESPGD